jgi:sec-independent protein translocase protein TatA
MAKLLDNPMTLLFLVLVMLLLFGAPKLPGMARSLGQSLRIFKSEVAEFNKDTAPSGAGAVPDGQPIPGSQSDTAPHGLPTRG